MFQHLEYFPFGETFVEEHSNTQRAPYLFTGKELDEDTGLYYYGARHYDPRTSLWQSADPVLAKYLPSAGEEAGPTDDIKISLPSLANNYGSPRHALPGIGGVFTGKNLSLYAYTQQNPVRYRDPDGRFFKEPAATGLAADVAVPEPSDAFLPKWAAWGVVIALAVAADYVIYDQITKTDEDDKDRGRYVYRALRSGELTPAGIEAKNPKAKWKQAQHVRQGKRSKSQWISTSKSLSRVLADYDSGNGVIRIDLDKLPSSAHDVSSGVFTDGSKHPVGSKIAIENQEVLIEKFVPITAIELVK